MDSWTELVELALLMPFLCWVVLGAIDFGRVYSNDIVAIGAARTGARVAADVRKQDSDVVLAVQRDASLVVHAGDIVISPAGTRAPGTDVTVSVTFRFAPITPIVSRLLPGGV